MNARVPARTAPIGAPNPLVKSIQRLSTAAAKSAAAAPDAAQAFSSRAPSRWTGTPRSCAHAETACSASSGHTAPPPKLWVCSTQTTPTGCPYGTGTAATRSMAAASSAGVKMPRAVRIGSTRTPEASAAPPDSARMTCAIPSAISASPGRVCTLTATRLHMVPVGSQSAASLPSSSATRACSRVTVGSSPFCSSPTSAAAMAARMPAVGRVSVSLKSETTPTASRRPGPAPRPARRRGR